MRRAIVFAIGAALLLIALIIKAPASLLDGRINAWSAGNLRMIGSTGTIWSGAGELRLAAANTGVPVSWQIDAWPVLLGELRGTLAGSDATTSPTSFNVSSSEVAVRNLAITLPANALMRTAGTPGSFATAGGNVSLRIGELTRRGDRIDGQVALRWDQATLQSALVGLRPSPRVALGDVRFDGTGQGNAIAGVLANAGGDVEISGTASASINGSSVATTSTAPGPAASATGTTFPPGTGAFGSPLKLATKASNSAEPSAQGGFSKVAILRVPSSTRYLAQ